MVAKIVKNIKLSHADKVSLVEYMFRDAIISREVLFMELICAFKCVFSFHSIDATVQKNTYNPYLKSQNSDENVNLKH